MKKHFTSKLVLIIGLLSFATNSFAQPTQDYSQKFNGDQIVVSTNTTTLNLGSTFTMEAWVYLKVASPYGIVLGKTFNPRANDPYQNYVISFDGTGLKPELVQTTGVVGSYRAATSPIPIILNTWTHLAASLNLGILKFYVNGVLVATSSSVGIPNNSPNVPFSIGSGSTPTSQTTCCGIIGAIKQVRVWNTERTLTQIAANKNLNLTGSETGLQACYPMNESSGQIINDISPNANHLIRGVTSNAETQDPTPVLEGNLGTFFTFTEIALPAIANSYDAIYAVNFNNDAYEDIVVSSIVWPPTIPASSQPLLAFTNNGNMNFSSAPAFVGNNQVVHPRDYCIGDFNGDSKTDLFIVDHGTDVSPFPGGQNQLFLQNTSGQLVNTPANIPTILDFSHNTATADIDKDGDLDIYVCNINGKDNIGPRFLINNGSGNFTVSTSRIPSNITNLLTNSVFMSSRFADIDKDGDMDLILGSIEGRNISKDLLLINNGAGNFTTGSAMPDRYGNSAWGTVSITVGDFNNDTWPDLLMSSLYQYQTCQIQLLINNQNGTFTDKTSNIPQSWGTIDTWINWIETGDFNNDGKIDFVCSEFGSDHLKLYLNKGNANFIEVSEILSIPTGNSIMSLKARDLDNDGRTDIAFICATKVIIAKNVKNYVVDNLNSTDFEKERKNSIVVYPNPAKNQINLQFPNQVVVDKVRITDLTGKVILEQTTNTTQVNVAKLAAGLYIIQAFSGKEKFQSKFIKE
jgi:hypothetical protein